MILIFSSTTVHAGHWHCVMYTELTIEGLS